MDPVLIKATSLIRASVIRSILLTATVAAMAQGAQESIVRTANDIFVIRIISSKPGEWRQSARQTKTRTVQLQIRAEKVLKGDGKPGETSIMISQTEPSGAMDVSVPGVWSRQSVDPSTTYVVFSKSHSLAESETIAVRPAQEALADTNLAIECELGRLTLPQCLEHGANHPLGILFAEYAAARLPEILFNRYDQFNALMAILEKESVGRLVRETLIEEIFSSFLLADPAPPHFVARLAAGSLRLIVQPDEKLRQRIVETLLPNLVGLEGGATKKSSAVLAEYPADAERAKRFLQTEPRAPAQRILAWLR
jgi:hypothetical protein